MTAYRVQLPRQAPVPFGGLTMALLTFALWLAAYRARPRRTRAAGARHRTAAPSWRAQLGAILARLRRPRPALTDPEWGAALRAIGARMAPHYRAR